MHSKYESQFFKLSFRKFDQAGSSTSATISGIQGDNNTIFQSLSNHFYTPTGTSIGHPTGSSAGSLRAHLSHLKGNTNTGPESESDYDKIWLDVLPEDVSHETDSNQRTSDGTGTSESVVVHPGSQGGASVNMAEEEDPL